LFLGKSTKKLPPELHFLTPICIKSFVAPPDPPTVFRKLTSKGSGEERMVGKGRVGRGGKRRGGEMRGRGEERKGRGGEGEEGGNLSFAIGRKKKSWRLWAQPPYGTRGTRPLQLWRSWRPSVFGHLQLQMAVVLIGAHCGTLIVLLTKYRREEEWGKEWAEEG